MELKQPTLILLSPEQAYMQVMRNVFIEEMQTTMYPDFGYNTGGYQERGISEVNLRLKVLDENLLMQWWGKKGISTNSLFEDFTINELLKIVDKKIEERSKQ